MYKLALGVHGSGLGAGAGEPGLLLALTAILKEQDLRMPFSCTPRHQQGIWWILHQTVLAFLERTFYVYVVMYTHNMYICTYVYVYIYMCIYVCVFVCFCVCKILQTFLDLIQSIALWRCHKGRAEPCARPCAISSLASRHASRRISRQAVGTWTFQCSSLFGCILGFVAKSQYQPQKGIALERRGGGSLVGGCYNTRVV